MDPYKVLGVPKNADERELKKAFKTKAMKYHPDRGGDENKFKEINEAYDILKDPQKKAAYDRYGTANPNMGGGPGFDFNFNGDINDIFNNFFGGGPFQRNTYRSKPRNADINIETTLDLEDVQTGKSLIASYRLPNGRQESVNIDIPPGVEHNNIIKFSGLGSDSVHNAPRGDLLLKVKILKHKLWDRDGANLYTTVRVSVLDLILGCKAEIKTLSGKNLSITVPKGTQSGTVFNLPEQGLPYVHNRNMFGSIFITVAGVTPKLQDEKILSRIESIKNEIDNAS